MTILQNLTQKAAHHKGEERKISAEKIEKGKKANAKTHLIRCDVDAARREVEKFVAPRSER